MFKDYDKYLSASLKVYLFILVIVLIMKIVGLDYFGLDVNNPTVLTISNFLTSKGYSDSILALNIYLQFYFFLCLVCDKRHLFMYALIGTIINLSGQALLFYYSKMDWLYYSICTIITIFLPMIINRKIFIKRQIKYIILITIYQYISLITRNINLHYEYGNFIVDTLLNIDQLLMLAITYNVYFMRGGLICSEQAVGLFSQMKKNLLDLPRNLLESSSNYKKLSKQEKATYIIYFTFSLVWNILTIIAILFVAKLNDTIIECIFILTSFWISKRIFGKAFHLKSMILCFVLSNVSYYVLNRITTPIGISILIPIMLGVGLSYVTSKFVKSYKPLYRGMPVEEFDDTILRLVDKGSDKYNICYDFFIKKENAVLLGRKYNYTEAGIRKITSRINNSIKALK